MPDQPARIEDANGAQPDTATAEPPAHVDSSRWLSGPDADPLREPPWFARPSASRLAGRPIKVTRPLARPRRFKPLTTWLRVRNSVVLVGLLVGIWFTVLGIRSISAQLSGVSPSLTHPTPVPTHTATPQPRRTPTPHHKP